MARAKIISTILIASGVALAGCANQGSQESSGQPTIIRDPNHIIATDHWEVLQIPGGGSPIATVNGFPPYGGVIVSCDDAGKLLLVSLLYGKELEGNISDRSLALTYDDDVTAKGNARRWVAQKETDGSASFYISDDDDFWPIVAELKTHRGFVAVIQSGNEKTLRYHFTLTGAAVAIDYILKSCGAVEPTNGT